MRSEQLVFFFQFSRVAPKISIQRQEDIAKSGYKKNNEVKNLGILLQC
jgi:hypothetical protein